MSDETKGPLPGNHGQFGVNNATEEHKHLEDGPSAPVPPTATLEEMKTPLPERPGGSRA